MSHMLKATHMVGKSVSTMKIKVVKVSLLMQCDLCTKVASLQEVGFVRSVPPSHIVLFQLQWPGGVDC